MTRCAGRTQKGTQCLRGPLLPSIYCSLHLPAEGPSDRTCPSCRVRWRHRSRMEANQPPYLLSEAMYAYLELLAREFVEEAEDEEFNAQEFVWWIKSTLLGSDVRRLAS